jgi:hypothetical protein
MQPNLIQRVTVDRYHAEEFDHHGCMMLIKEGYRVHVVYPNSIFDEEIYIDDGLVCSRDWAELDGSSGF